MNKNWLYSCLLLVFIWSCTEDDGDDIASVEERVEAAVSDLKERLTAPANGWAIEYRPTPESGCYFVMLNFDENEVRVRSDMPGDDGYFYDHVIPYRVDVQLDVELIFETFAMFHVLFEHEQSSFGGEFEFLYIGENNGVLAFQSKSDQNNPTILEMVPATSGDDARFSRSLALNLQSYDTLQSRVFTRDVYQQLYIENQDVSVFWEVDLVARNIRMDLIAEGQTIEEIEENNNWEQDTTLIPFCLDQGRIILDREISINLPGKSFSFSIFEADELTFGGDLVCDATSFANYDGIVTDQGPASLTRTLFHSGGFDFDTRDDSYSVNVLFVVDGDGSSLSEDGSISELYPDADGFVFNYGVIEEDNEGEPTYGVGLVFEDENGNVREHYRGYEMTEVSGNTIEINLTEEFFYKNENDPPADSEDNLRTVTDEIFEDPTFYISQLRHLEGLGDIVLFKLRNACSGFEIILVQPEQ